MITLVPVGNIDVEHVATPEVTCRVTHPGIALPPTSNSMVPLAPLVTEATNVTGEPEFCGDRSGDVRLVEVDESGDTVSEAPVEGELVPPALVAVTVMVSAPPALRPGIVHDVAGAETVHELPSGLAVAVYPSTAKPPLGVAAFQDTRTPPTLAEA